jgi:hypothetical protein
VIGRRLRAGPLRTHGLLQDRLEFFSKRSVVGGRSLDKQFKRTPLYLDKKVRPFDTPSDLAEE